MGKAALLIVLGLSLAGATVLLSSTDSRGAQADREAYYDETLLAREIARTGYNMAMSVLQRYGDNLHAGVAAVNGTTEGMRGQHQGGHFYARAFLLDGHTAGVISTGYFQRAHHTVGDQHQLRVLEVRQDSELSITFLNSWSDYCSAVFLEQIKPWLPASQQPGPVLLFEANNRRDGLGTTLNQVLEAGTQLNFFIAVDKNCTLRPSDVPSDREAYNSWLESYRENHVFDRSIYHHIHRALDVEVGRLEDMQESPWAMVEQHPSSNQRWRIAWEDQHVPGWLVDNDRESNLEILKEEGYDGAGWVDLIADGYCEPQPGCKTVPDGYRDLRQYSGRPDFSDQVIEINLRPVVYSTSSNSWGDGSGEGESGGGGEETTDSEGAVDLDAALANGCPCQAGKAAILHRPPGNEANEQLLCLPPSAIRAHLQQHDDVLVCEGGSSRGQGRK